MNFFMYILNQIFLIKFPNLNTKSLEFPVFPFFTITLHWFMIMSIGIGACGTCAAPCIKNVLLHTLKK